MTSSAHPEHPEISNLRGRRCDRLVGSSWRIHEASLSTFFQNSRKVTRHKCDAFSVVQKFFPFSPSHATFNVLL